MVLYEGGDDAQDGLSDRERAQRGERATDTGEWNGEEVRYLARRVVVKLAAPDWPEGDESAAAALDTACEEVCEATPGGRMARPLTATRRMVVELEPGQDPRNVARELAERDDVAYAEPDLIDHEAVVPNDTRYVDQWAPGVVNAEDAWDLETGDDNVVIGIVDSGISMTGGSLDHPDLDDPSRFILGTDFVDGGTPRDTRGHGTHVTGIAAGEGDNNAGIAGMNWGSLVYVCRTFDQFGNGSSADFAAAVEEITDYALANGIKAVINYSGGGGDNLTKRDACEYASDNGMLLVAAVGNDNGGPVIAPASYSTTITGVIAVGATDEDDSVSSFSNVGPEVTVVAPGNDIMSTMPTYAVTLPAGPDFGSLPGTSMATPLVSGLAALIWSRHPSFTNQRVKDCIKDTAVELGSGSFDDSWGHGRVDAEAALRCGDFIVPSTLIGPSCGRSRVPSCAVTTRVGCGTRTRITTCFPSRLRSCPPQSTVRVCVTPSVLPNLCPTSRVSPDCRQSWVDACPSALDPNCGGGTVIDPRTVIDPIRDPGLAGDPRSGPRVDPRVAGGRFDALTADDQEVWVDDSGRFWWTTEE